MSRKNLILASEVNACTNTGSHVANNILCVQIPIVEECLFRECLGMQLYRDMQANLCPTDAPCWDESLAYVTGSFVSYEGQIYEAIADAPPGNNPLNINFWKVADRFKNPCYENLWCMYLKQAIAFRVVSRTVIPHGINFSPIGVVRKQSDNSLASD